MNDSHVVVTNESWFQRMGKAFVGILVGILLAVLAGGLLFWNEGRAVETRKTLEEGGANVLTVSAESVDQANEGLLVHLSGPAVTEAVLKDPDFSVEINAIKLRRTVDMYQWTESVKTETRTKAGGGKETTKTYSYSKSWSDRVVDASRFDEPAGHTNPGSLPYPARDQVAGKVTLGAFTLPASLVSSMGDFTSLPVAGDAPIPETLRKPVQHHNGGFYLGADPGAPDIGDVRVTFQVVKPGEVSVIARQVGRSFEAYRARAGGSIEMLQSGLHSADAMIQQALARNKGMTWGIRLGGLLLMAFGFGLFLRPLTVLADVIPPLGRLVGAGLGLVAFLSALFFSLLVIAAGWIIYRPLVGILVLLVAVVLVVLVVLGVRRRKARHTTKETVEAAEG